MGRRVVRLYLYFLIKSLFLESLTDLIISQGNLSLSGKLELWQTNLNLQGTTTPLPHLSHLFNFLLNDCLEGGILFCSGSLTAVHTI